ncbi:hypothetical protein EJ02DRAFT_421955 [Clathrospora elynae]|uniref:Uncharacterized protein n=1 Tax=Clathrospora elynae TaxID=706981 RepID=A0A6A5SW38_9PLEO|nr:hypothetical protein EJ02DRAFT_421955 [Clathrospora elynae]
MAPEAATMINAAPSLNHKAPNKEINAHEKMFEYICTAKCQVIDSVPSGLGAVDRAFIDGMGDDMIIKVFGHLWIQDITRQGCEKVAYVLHPQFIGVLYSWQQQDPLPSCKYLTYEEVRELVSDACNQDVGPDKRSICVECLIVDLALRSNWTGELLTMMGSIIRNTEYRDEENINVFANRLITLNIRDTAIHRQFTRECLNDLNEEEIQTLIEKLWAMEIEEHERNLILKDLMKINSPPTRALCMPIVYSKTEPHKLSDVPFLWSQRLDENYEQHDRVRIRVGLAERMLRYLATREIWRRLWCNKKRERKADKGVHAISAITFHRDESACDAARAVGRPDEENEERESTI